MRSRGLTLIELMIVISIIVIVVGISVPFYLRAKMAGNETGAVGCCHAFAEAEAIYRRTDWDKDGSLEFTPALYGPYSLSDDKIALIDRSLGLAEGDPATGLPKAGYVFRVMTSQNIAGVVSSYYSQGHMVLGYALSALPEQYDGAGRNSFIISNEGNVYQKAKGKLGNVHETVFNPDTTWVMVQ